MRNTCTFCFSQSTEFTTVATQKPSQSNTVILSASLTLVVSSSVRKLSITKDVTIAAANEMAKGVNPGFFVVFGLILLYFIQAFPKSRGEYQSIDTKYATTAATITAI